MTGAGEYLGRTSFTAVAHSAPIKQALASLHMRDMELSDSMYFVQDRN